MSALVRIVGTTVFACEIGRATWTQTPLDPLAGVVVTLMLAGLAVHWCFEG